MEFNFIIIDIKPPQNKFFTQMDMSIFFIITHFFLENRNNHIDIIINFKLRDKIFCITFDETNSKITTTITTTTTILYFKNIQVTS